MLSQASVDPTFHHCEGQGKLLGSREVGLTLLYEGGRAVEGVGPAYQPLWGGKLSGSLRLYSLPPIDATGKVSVWSS